MVPWWAIPLAAWAGASIAIAALALLQAGDDRPRGAYIDENGEVIG